MVSKLSEHDEHNSRLKEANQREQLLRPLHSLEKSILELCLQIKSELREIVTYFGVPYVEKMKTDYTEIVKKCGRLNPNASYRSSVRSKYSYPEYRK